MCERRAAWRIAVRLAAQFATDVPSALSATKR